MPRADEENMFNVLELLNLAIQIEVNGERFFRHAVERVGAASLKELLGWLADEEVRHKAVLTSMKEEEVDRPKSSSSGPFVSLSQQALRAAMGRHVFSLDELELESITGEMEILRAAIVFEEDTILFFEFIASFVSDAGPLSTLERIRQEELNHKRLLTEKMSEIERETLK